MTLQLWFGLFVLAMGLLVGVITYWLIGHDIKKRDRPGGSP